MMSEIKSAVLLRIIGGVIISLLWVFEPTPETVKCAGPVILSSALYKNPSF